MPKPMMVHRAAVDGVDFAYLERGSGPLVLCIHGFPDTAYSFVPLLNQLAKAGYRAVAPFLPGYWPSGLDRDGDYRITTVSQRLLALQDALGAPTATWVGHDWGAAASYVAAAMAPERITAMVTAALPPLRRFLLQPTLKQLYRSRYIGLFQLPHWPEQRMVEADFAWLRALIRSWSPRWGYTDQDLAPIFDVLSRPTHRQAALAYYRRMPSVAFDPRHWRLLRARIDVPTQIIAGVDDGCIGIEMFHALESVFSQDYALVEISGAGHFMHCEQPLRFAKAVLAWVDAHPASR